MVHNLCSTTKMQYIIHQRITAQQADPSCLNIFAKQILNNRKRQVANVSLVVIKNVKVAWNLGKECMGNNE